MKRTVKSWRCLYCGTTTTSEGAMINHSFVAHRYSEPSFEVRDVETLGKAVKVRPASQGNLGEPPALGSAIILCS